MKTEVIYRFEDPTDGSSKFRMYYRGGLPGPEIKDYPEDPDDEILWEAWKALGYPNFGDVAFFGFESLRQASKSMNVEDAILNGHIVELEVERGGVIFCETQCIYDPFSVAGVKPLQEESNEVTEH